MTPAVKPHGCNGMDEGELEDRGKSGQRLLSPAADMPPKMLTAAMCHCTKSLRDSGEVRLGLSAVST